MESGAAEAAGRRPTLGRVKELAVYVGPIVAAVTFAAQFVALDVVFSSAPAWWRRAGSVRGALASVLVWGVGLAIARDRRVVRVALSAVAAVLVVAQLFVFRFVHSPLDLQIAEAARHSYLVVRPVFIKTLPLLTGAFAVVFLGELLLLGTAKAARWRRWPPAGIVLAVPLFWGLCPDPRVATPDVRAMHALGALRHHAPLPQSGAVALPTLHSTRRVLPDVLFILTESVRGDDYVSAGPDATAPYTTELTATRVELAELRSISSYTAISLSAILTGRSQEGRREDILSAPNLFDFARAAGLDVGYYSAQSRDTFETKDVRAAIDHFVTLETLAGHDVEDDSEWVYRPLDSMVVDRFLSELPGRPPPAMTVLHLYGTHAPYYFEDDKAKFQPFDRTVAWSTMKELRNAYRNAILEQDRQVARALRAFLDHARERQRPWLVVFTSDHGEAFGEHGAIHHGYNLYDEQLRVPGWIATSDDLLTGGERRELESERARFVTHLDLLPTVLDALGVFDNFSSAEHVARMQGQSLLRPWTSHAPIPITNCTKMFPCPINTWGVLADDRKLLTHAWQAPWRCLDLSGIEREVPLQEPTCAALLEASRGYFPALANGEPAP